MVLEYSPNALTFSQHHKHLSIIIPYEVHFFTTPKAEASYLRGKHEHYCACVTGHFHPKMHSKSIQDTITKVTMLMRDPAALGSSRSVEGALNDYVAEVGVLLRRIMDMVR